ncbi:MAG: uncharacterized membrane protein YjjP (DUF1212 family) [Planctomycetota bacterium]|jgi:uncharacterized membrane protein YjjP (DUF1212 family)
MEQEPESKQKEVYVFLARCAEVLHFHGTPAHRLERVMVTIAASLGVEASFLYTPTSIFASFGRIPNEEMHLLRANGGALNLGKLVEIDELMESIQHRRISVAEGLVQLEAIDASPLRWSAIWQALAFGLASGGAARFFGGGVLEILLAFALGPCLLILGRLLPKHQSENGLFEPIAAFFAAMTALLVARFAFAIDDRVVILSSLIILMPGLTLTTAMTELATRHLVSGVARLAGAAVVFLTMLLGVALAWRLGSGPVAAADFLPEALPDWTLWIAVAVTPFAFAVILEARGRELGIIYAAAIAGFAASYGTAETLGSDLSPFVGALVVGLIANIYARLANRPALVPMTPGILLLVPGSLGFRSLTSFLDREALAGMEWAFQTGMVAVALVGGLLLAGLLIPPRRVL